MKLFFDIDTQLDFVVPAGALYAPGAERVIEPVARLNRFAAANGIPVISSMCAHPEDSREFRQWPPHCVSGTFGQQKPAATLLETRAVIPNAPGEYEIAHAPQIIVEKDSLDLFSNPNLPALLDRLGADECVVYGVFAEYCVRCAVTGLLGRGAKVCLVREATAAADETAGGRAIGEFIAASGLVIGIDEALAAVNRT